VAELVKGKELPKIDADQLKQIEETKQQIFAPLGRKADYVVHPTEFESYVRGINHEYVGLKKYTAKMKRGLELVKRAKDGCVPLLTADNPHELMRTIEAKNIADLAEVHIQASIMRDESRLGTVHYRVEYPEKNDDKWYDKLVTVGQVNGEFKFGVTQINVGY